MSTILITGGTGLLGTAIRKRLIEAGHSVRILSRNPNSYGDNNESYFQWDLEANRIDEAAFVHLDGIIHLAGTSVAESPWSENKKKDIINSRVASGKLLHDYCLKLGVDSKFFISASGVAFYGTITSNQIFTEKHEMGSGFLAKVAEIWENSADRFNEGSTLVSKVRISTVLAKNGGAFPKLALPIKWGFGSSLGSGKQWFPWIHIDDLAKLFVWIMEQKKSGIYNGCAPDYINNHDFTKLFAKKMKRPFFIPAVPSLVLQLILGKEMANEIILNGSRISSEKAMKEGYQFQFPRIEKAIEDLLG